MRILRTTIAIIVLVGAASFRAFAEEPPPTPAPAPLPELKPVPGTPVSMWWNSRTGNFEGAGQIWGEVRNDGKKPLRDVRVRFSAYDVNGKVIGVHSDNVRKLAPGEIWSFELHPKGADARRFELKDVKHR